MSSTSNGSSTTWLYALQKPEQRGLFSSRKGGVEWRFTELYGFYNDDGTIDTFALIDLKKWYAEYMAGHFTLERGLKTTKIIDGKLTYPITTNTLSAEGLNASFVGIGVAESMRTFNDRGWIALSGTWKGVTRELCESKHCPYLNLGVLH